jgi:HAD superfamily hydrolase (TIGR01549 family)
VEAVNFYADEFGYRKVMDGELPELQCKSAREVMKILGISMWQLPRVAYKAKRRIRERIDTLEPISGVAQLIRGLNEAGLQLGILTSNSEENVRYFLKKNHLDVFDFIYADSSIFGKASVLKKVLKEMKLDRNQVLYIGDETRDIEAAKSSRVKVASVSWGFNSKKALLSKNPDFFIEQPHELRLILAGTPE